MGIVGLYLEIFFSMVWIELGNVFIWVWWFLLYINGLILFVRICKISVIGKKRYDL